jgi:hypothetical protein
LFEQVVVVGVHDPMQAPLTHAWFEQATALPHWPSAPQVWTPLPEQVVDPGTHTPPQPPFTHANAHALAGPHVPEAEQVATPVLEPPLASGMQLVVVGLQTPWHDAPPLLSATQA